MKKSSNQISFKLVNVALVIIIVCLLYLIRGLWLGIVGKVLDILFPFLLAFVIAYAMYPLQKKLRDNGAPKWLAVLVVCIIAFGLIISMVILVVPLLYNQIVSFLSNISVFISDIANRYELNLGVLQSSISEFSTSLLKSIGTYISDGAITVVNTSISVITTFAIVAFVSVYILKDMDRIREYIKTKLSKFRNRSYLYVETLDKEITNYFTGLGLNILIQLIEYTTVFFLIGHPNYLILGILAAVTTIIPYFGGLIINILALLIASVVSTKLFLLTLAVCIICPQIDGYIIGPRVYGKTNKLNPLVNIFAVFAGGILGGFWGIVVSLPIAIIIITTYKFFKSDIDKKIVKIKGKEKIK